MIMTSYFARLKALEADGLLERCVPICRHLPRWLPSAVSRRNHKGLAPPVELLRARKDGWLSWEKFAATFEREVLGPQEPEAVLATLRALAGGHDPVLLCYCQGADGQCHRFLVARWLQTVTPVQEWTPPEPPASTGQGSLF